MRMFTGIITDVGRVRRREERGDVRFEIETAFDLASVDIGASIACSGICLTVVEKGADWFAVDVSAETLACTTVGTWQEGTAMTIILNQATPLADILDSLKEVPAVSTIGQEPLTGEPNPTLLKKASAIPRLNNRNRKTLFVTLRND